MAVQANPIKILVINPNSSSSITDALKRALLPSSPDIDLDFFNPKSGPAGISDPITAAESTEACLAELTSSNATVDLLKFDGALIACFSEHPLIERLDAWYASKGSNAKVLGIYHAAVSFALLTPGKFGILATGSGEKPNLVAATATFLGSSTSERFAGPLTTGLQVVELQDGSLQDKVEKGMKETTGRLLSRGATTIIFGCAGMSGMNQWVHEVAAAENKKARIVDGVKAGVQMLACLIRS